MRTSIPTLALRWAATLYGILLLPAMLAGSICFRSGYATTLELGGCVCLEAPAERAAVPSLDSADCGPCQDVTVSARAGSRALSCSGPWILLQHVPGGPDVGARVSTPCVLRHSGERAGRSPTVLRC